MSLGKQKARKQRGPLLGEPYCESCTLNDINSQITGQH
jgi:hypothetical protein